MLEFDVGGSVPFLRPCATTSPMGDPPNTFDSTNVRKAMAIHARLHGEDVLYKGVLGNRISHERFAPRCLVGMILGSSMVK